MHKLVVLNEYLEKTYSQTIALEKTQRTTSNDDFAKLEVLESSNFLNKGGVGLSSCKKLSFCEVRALK